MRKFLISAGRIQSMIITSARACLSGVLETSYEPSLSLTDSNEKWSGKSSPSFSRWSLRSFWILLDKRVISGLNVTSIIVFEALSFSNSLRSLERLDVLATGLGAVSAMAFAIALHLFHQDCLA